MVHDTLIISNKLGLDTRAASKLVEVALRFQSSINFRKTKDEKPIDGKSTMAIMMLEVAQGTKLLLEIEGPDEKNAHAAIVNLVGSAFGETIHG